MKSSLEHLPKLKREELKKIVAIIQKNYQDIEKIILFGSYARGNYKEVKDLNPKQKTGHISDYDLLVVTKKADTVDQFISFDAFNKLKLSAPAKITACDIESLNINLAEGQYFFTDVKKEGIILYDTKKYQLASKRKLKPAEKQRIAKDYFNHWFCEAKYFFEHYEISLAKSTQNIKRLSQAAFFLHQAVEHAYKATLLVFTNYSPREHYLKILGKMAAKHYPDLAIFFPKETRQEKDRFKLLEYAYIGGRYDKNYRIAKKDLEILAKDVKRLLGSVKKICQIKIQSFNRVRKN